VPDTTGIRLERGIDLVHLACMTLSDSTGRFEFRNVPTGDHQLRVADLGIRAVAPVSVRVTADSVTYVEIHLQAENRILDCEAVPACARILAPLDSTAQAALSDSMQLLAVAVRTTIAISSYADESHRPVSAVCVTWRQGGHDLPLPIAVSLAVRRVVPVIRDGDACILDRTPGENYGTLHTADASNAWAYLVHFPSMTSGTASGEASLYVAPLWGEGFECDYRRESDGWRPIRCRGTWIS
jgi:hypothetical protein